MAVEHNYAADTVTIMMIILISVTVDAQFPNQTTSSNYLSNDNHVPHPHEDDVNFVVNLPESFSFKGVPISTFYVSPNGAIRTQDIKRVDPSDPIFPFPNRDILPFFADSNFKINCPECKVTSKVNPEQSIQTKIDKMVQMSNAAGHDAIAGNYFGDPSRTLIVTWYKAPSYSRPALKNTFQAILTSDGVNSFGIFSYLELQYPSDSSYKVQVKVDGNQYVNLIDTADSVRSPLPQKLLCRSNMFLPGTLLVKLGDNFNYPYKNITSSCSHCAGEESWNSVFPPGQKQCGSNGKTYDSKEELESEICRTKGQIYLLQSGECDASTTPTSFMSSTKLSPKDASTTPTSPMSSTKMSPEDALTTPTNPMSSTKMTPKDASTTPTSPMSSTKMSPKDASTTPTSPMSSTKMTPKDESTTPKSHISSAGPSPKDCTVNNGGCSDLCSDTSGQVVCSCSYGNLMNDGRCNVTNFIFFGADTFLDMLDPVSSLVQNVETPAAYIIGITFDYVKNNILLGLYVGNSVSYIGVYSLEMKTLEYLVKLSNTSIEDIGYDHTMGSLYYSDYHGSVNVISDIYHSNRSIILVSTFVRPRGLALDYCRRLLFVTDWAVGKVYKLDETLRAEAEIANGLSQVNGITIDRDNYKLYWGDSYFDVIEEANYDGSCRRTVTSMFNTHLYGMTFLNGFLYWSSWIQRNGTYGIYKTEVSTGNSILAASPGNRPRGIDAFKPTDIAFRRCITSCTLKPQLLNQSGMYPYGPEYGDSKMKKSHYGSAELKLPNDTNPLYVFNDGFISFGYSLIAKNEVTLPYRKATVVLGYYSPFTTTRFFGDVYYRVTTNSTLRAMAHREIILSYMDTSTVGTDIPLILIPTHLAIVTWSGLAQYNDGNKRNTFQVVIAFGQPYAHIIYRYPRLDITNGIAGFSENKCYNFVKIDTALILFKRSLVVPLKAGNCNNVTSTRPPTTTISVTSTKETLPSTSPATTIDLYPLDNDLILPPGDDRPIGILNFPDGIPLFSNAEYNMSISINGHVTMGDIATTVVPPISGSANTGKTQILIYASDLITTGNKGNIYYRKTDDFLILKRAALDIGRSRDAAGFNPKLAVVVTYQNVAAYGSSDSRQTFQMVLATDYVNTFLILLYQKLTQSNARVGYSEKFCDNYKIINNRIRSDQLVFGSNVGKPGMFVYKLSQPHCRKNTAATPPISLIKKFTIDTGVEMIYPFRTTKRIAAVFVQLVSTPSSQFPSSSFLTRNSYYTAGYYNISYIYDSGDKLETTFLMQFLVLSIEVNQTSMFQYGEVYFPSFSSRTTCQRRRLYKKMDGTPVIKLSGIIPYDRYNKFAGFTSLWLRNVSSYTFDICLREMFSFTGPRTMFVNYIAVTGGGNKNANHSTDPFTESGIQLFKSGPLDPLISGENNRSCQFLKFQYRYHDAPYIFITPEELNATVEGELIAWVKVIDFDKALICARSTLDMPYMRVADIKVHYMINGSLDRCSTFKCPSHLECQTDTNGTLFCGCRRVCLEAYIPVCGTDFYTYDNLCSLNKRVCELYGPNATNIVSVAYSGQCKHFPYMSGKELLDPVPSIPVVFCKDIELNEFMFQRYARIHIVLTVTWDKSTINAVHDATASWSENVSPRGFRACVLVAGRHFYGLPDSPSVYWVAYQGGFPSTLANEWGVIRMPTWYTGTMCQILDIKGGRGPFNSTVSLGVEHSTPRMYRNAMTAWFEQYNINGTVAYKICARELQNFDGVHEGIDIHYLVFHDRHSPFISEMNQLHFPKKHFTTHHPLSSVCQISRINQLYPVLPNPTVMLTNIKVSNNPASFNNQYSVNDFAAWIEFSNITHMKYCAKSIRSGLNREEINLHYMIIPALCESGWYYHDGKCFVRKKDEEYNAGGRTCNLLNASLPVADSAPKNHFIEMLAGAKDTWIGYSDNITEGSWKWVDGSNSTFTRWRLGKPDGGRSENCAVIDTSSITRGWDDKSCLIKNQVYCEKDREWNLRLCRNFCKNDATCSLDPISLEINCTCPIEFTGKYCENKVMDQPECRDAVLRDEPWRLYENKTSINQTRECDHRNLMSNATWYRFKDQKMMESFCPNATNRCGHIFPGWLEKPHPLVSDGIVNMEIFYYQFYCGSDFGRVRVRNCGKFFVYHFTFLPFWTCEYGICMEKNSK